MTKMIRFIAGFLGLLVILGIFLFGLAHTLGFVSPETATDGNLDGAERVIALIDMLISLAAISRTSLSLNVNVSGGSGPHDSGLSHFC